MAKACKKFKNFVYAILDKDGIPAVTVVATFILQRKSRW